MPDPTPATCPKCGSDACENMPDDVAMWTCGSNIGSNFDQGFWQSDLCKLRQSHALLAECFAVIEEYAFHREDCHKLLRVEEGFWTTMHEQRDEKCSCGKKDRIAALRSRYEEMKG